MVHKLQININDKVIFGNGDQWGQHIHEILLFFFNWKITLSALFSQALKFVARSNEINFS